MKTVKIIFSAILIAASLSGSAREWMGNTTGGRSAGSVIPMARTNGGCTPATARLNLDINNVRTLILNGNDMWWDQGSSGNARYEIPRVDDPTQVKRHSLFAGSIWIGGKAQGQLRVAAQTYRQTSTLGVGFWPGPLDTLTANIDASQCAKFDRHWMVYKRDIDKHKANSLSPDPNYITPSSINDWPAMGDPIFNQETFLAPFIDVDGNNIYDPASGDYPDVRGDQAIWWVTNDKGNTPQSSGDPKTAIGMEIQSLAFAYQRNDELNNMTFYRNKITNRSSFTLDSCFMAQWADPDLGQATDDYIGCDVTRGLGICYNGDDNDEGIAGYGQNPPSVGIDFFEGPYSDANDGIDNDRDCLVDEIDDDCYGPNKTEKCIMSKFMYFTNGAIFPLGDPRNHVESYNFLIARWQDGSPLTYGGNGTGGTIQSEMAFPGSSDGVYGWSARGNCQSPVPGLPEWSERTAGNPPGDRRFVQSGGPFTLKAGAVNYVTIGVVWARSSSGGAIGSFNLLLEADTKAQALFESCFRTVDGPDNPDMDVVELDRELILNLSYKPGSNNYKLGYKESDPILVKLAQADPTIKDTTFKFEGFKIYQLANGEVSLGELRDLSKARLIFQNDLKNGIKKIVNWYNDTETGLAVPRLEVDGADNGIQMSYRVTKDAFAVTGDRLINHRPYYFIAVAYAYNSYKPYDISLKIGQAKPYLEGGNSIIKMSIPHKYESMYDGLILNSAWGTGPEVKRIDGVGNMGNILEFTDATVAEILKSPDNRALFPVYKSGFSPITITVTDPTIVAKGDFNLGLYRGNPKSGLAIDTSSRWYIAFEGGNDTIWADTSIYAPNQQMLVDEDMLNGKITFTKLGLAASIRFGLNPGMDQDNGNGTLESTMVPTQTATDRWLDLLQDQDVVGSFNNWILAGPASETGNMTGDTKEFYEKVVNGGFTAYRFASRGDLHPGWNDIGGSSGNNLADAASVDIVFTSDTTKWTKAIVLEMGIIPQLNEGGQKKSQLRKGLSIEKNGQVTDGVEMGRGWFPGYALNLETGERLNIAFGENSFFANQNGADMKWNPTAANFDSTGQRVWGGFHNIYVMKSLYDKGDRYLGALTTPTIDAPNTSGIRNFYREVMWVAMPKLSFGATLLSKETKVRIRQSKAYGAYKTRETSENANLPLYSFSTDGIAPIKNDRPTVIASLNNIRIVPNPYYAFNVYESSQLDTRVKVTNLPRKCTVKIYNTNGVLIRTLVKDNSETFMVWDLKNQARIPIASGMYIFHIDSEFGEKIVKWFGALRPTDLDTF